MTTPVFNVVCFVIYDILLLLEASPNRQDIIA